MPTILTHKHRILPRHMGGTYALENVVVLTVADHAEAHRLLWVFSGKREDYLAWRGLSGAIGKEEIIHERTRLGGRMVGGHPGNTFGKANTGKVRTQEMRRHMSAVKKGSPGYWTGKKHPAPASPEYRAKMRAAANRRWDAYRASKEAA